MTRKEFESKNLGIFVVEGEYRNNSNQWGITSTNVAYKNALDGTPEWAKSCMTKEDAYQEIFDYAMYIKYNSRPNQK